MTKRTRLAKPKAVYPAMKRLKNQLRTFRKPLKNDTGGINPCWKPSNEATKADLQEYHREEMALRRARQRSQKGLFG